MLLLAWLHLNFEFLHLILNQLKLIEFLFPFVFYRLNRGWYCHRGQVSDAATFTWFTTTTHLFFLNISSLNHFRRNCFKFTWLAATFHLQYSFQFSADVFLIHYVRLDLLNFCLQVVLIFQVFIRKVGGLSLLHDQTLLQILNLILEIFLLE